MIAMFREHVDIMYQAMQDLKILRLVIAIARGGVVRILSLAVERHDARTVEGVGKMEENEFDT